VLPAAPYPVVPIVHVNRSVMVLGRHDVTLQFQSAVRYLTVLLSTFLQPIFYSLASPHVEQEALGRPRHKKAHAQCTNPSGRTCRKEEERPEGPNPLSGEKKAPPKHAVQETKKTELLLLLG